MSTSVSCHCFVAQREWRKPGAWLVPFVAKLRGRLLRPESQHSHHSHLTSSFVHITPSSQWEHVAEERFMEQAIYPCPCFFPPFFLSPAHWDASRLSQSFLPVLLCEEFVMIQWFTTNSKEKAHIRHLTTWSHLAARTLKFSYYQGYEKHSKTPSKWGESHSFCIQTHLKGLLVALVKYYEHNVKPLVAWWECSTSCPPHKSLVHIKPKISLTVGYQSVALLCGDELSVPEVIHQRLHPHLHLCKTSLTFHANDLQTINLHSSTK